MSRRGGGGGGDEPSRASGVAVSPAENDDDDDVKSRYDDENSKRTKRQTNRVTNLQMTKESGGRRPFPFSLLLLSSSFSLSRLKNLKNSQNRFRSNA